MTSYRNLTGDFPLLIRGKPAPRSRPSGGGRAGEISAIGGISKD